MRNPWGGERYFGPWSDKSKEMTEHAMKFLGHQKKNDGAFWVPMNLWMSMFGGVDVIYKKDWKSDQRTRAWDRS
jgi:hypothetical protein